MAMQRTSGFHDIISGMKRHGKTEVLARSHPGHFHEYMFGERMGEWHWDMWEAFMWAMEDASERTPFLLLAPRQFGKTSLFESYVAWRIGNDPDERIKIVSSKVEIASQRVQKIARIIRSKRYQALFGDLYPDGEAGYAWRGDALDVKNERFENMDEDEFMNARRDNTLQALGIDGSVAGGRATCMVFDDIVTTENSKTDLSRSAVASKFSMEYLPIPMPGAPVIILGTRYHEEDLYSQLVQQYDTERRYMDYYPSMGGDHLPEMERDREEVATGGGTVRIYSAYDEEGKLLWPDRPQPDMGDGMSLKEKIKRNWDWLMGIKKSMAVAPGSFEAQYLNDTSYLSGAQYKMEWLQYYGGSERPAMQDLVGHIGCDPAMSTRAESRYTGVCTVALDRIGRRVYVLGFNFGHWESTTHLQQIQSEHQRWQSQGLMIAGTWYEVAGPIQGIFDFIKRELAASEYKMPFEAVRAKGSKPERFDQLAQWIRDGIIVFPGERQSNGSLDLMKSRGFDEFRREFTRFNGEKTGSRTDLLDALYIAANMALELPQAAFKISENSAYDEIPRNMSHREEIQRIRGKNAQISGDRRRIEAAYEERQRLEHEKRGFVRGMDPEYLQEGRQAPTSDFRSQIRRDLQRRAGRLGGW